MDKIDKREMISALADGQLAGDAFAQCVELAATDPAARDAWHTYHLIGDALRSSDLAGGTPAQRFLAGVQARLREERIEIHGATPESAVVMREAANDFRWKLVAGVASVAAVSAIAWSLVGGAPAKPEAAQLASGTPPAGTVLATTKQGMMIRDPRLDELLAAHRQLGGAALVAPAGYLRNATFDGPAR